MKIIHKTVASSKLEEATRDGWEFVEVLPGGAREVFSPFHGPLMSSGEGQIIVRRVESPELAALEAENTKLKDALKTAEYALTNETHRHNETTRQWEQARVRADKYYELEVLQRVAKPRKKKPV